MVCSSIIFITIISSAFGTILHMNIPEFNRNISENEVYLHLKNDKIKTACGEREKVCKSNDIVVCTARQIKNQMEYKEYNNSCYLFMSNMCDYPGQEFNIVRSTTCAEYLKTRRHSLLPPKTDIKSEISSKTKITTEAKPLLRQETTFSTIYDIDTAFDNHICPLSCPDTYIPVCLSVNRGFGLYYKFYTFVNHCEADRYYCKNWEDFSPPPGENEKIQTAYLGWSYCGSSRYLQFTRFSETASSLGHYGWLSGEYRFSHIMESHERKPGYG